MYDNNYILSMKNKFINKEIFYSGDKLQSGYYKCDSIGIKNWGVSNPDYYYTIFISNEDKSISIKINPKMNDIELADVWREKQRIKEEEKLLEEKKKQNVLKKERAEYQAKLEKKYGKQNAILIMNGEVRIGFTKSMCEEAWGLPSSVHTTTTAKGTLEQWVYNINSYLYFDGNKLVAIQN